VAHNGRLRLKRHYSIVAHSPDVVELRYGTWSPTTFTLADESRSGHLLSILSQLDGRLSPTEIATAQGIPRAEVESLIDRLMELDVLEDGSAHALDHYLDNVVPNLLPYEGQADPTASSVLLLGEPSISQQVARLLATSIPSNRYDVPSAGDRLRSLLSTLGSAWLQDGLVLEQGMRDFEAWRDHFVVFSSATLNPIELRNFNRVSLHHRIPWIHASIDGPFLLVGPTFVPLRSACYECLDTRVMMNLRESASYQDYKRALAERRVAGRPAPFEPILGNMLAALTAFEALNFLLTGTSFTLSKMLALYLPTMEFTFNEVLQLPGCAACSPSPERDDRELYFDVRALLKEQLR
jgi:bacteriocin biosynthesis cyclodehydratase domain-containing protein